MYEIIHQWLRSSQNYTIGVELLRRYGNNTFLLNLLAKTEDNWNAKQLANELQKIANSIPEIHEEEALKDRVNKIVAQEKIRPSDAKNAPKEILDIVEQRKQIYNEAKKLHSRLELFGDKEKCRKACFRILAIRAELKKIWRYTNFFDENNRLPETVTSPEIAWQNLDDMSLNNEWNKHYKYIKKFINDATKQTTIKERITLAFHIKEILNDRAAFAYPNLNMPTLK